MHVLSLMKYKVWTTAGFSARARIAPSDRVPGTLGLFPKGPCPKNANIASYPGALLFEEEYQKFNDAWACPTAVRASVLDYKVGDAGARALGLSDDCRLADGVWEVRMILVGDPRSAGALANSPLGIKGARANCRLAACCPEDLHHYLRKLKDGRYLVNAEIIGVVRVDEDLSKPDEELFVSYDALDGGSVAEGDGFWTAIRQESAHCGRCFSKDASIHRPMFLCSHQVDTSVFCPSGWHSDCLEDAEERARLNMGDAVWLCKLHTGASFSHRHETPAVTPPRPAHISASAGPAVVTPPRSVRTMHIPSSAFRDVTPPRPAHISASTGPAVVTPPRSVRTMHIPSSAFRDVTPPRPAHISASTGPAVVTSPCSGSAGAALLVGSPIASAVSFDPHTAVLPSAAPALDLPAHRGNMWDSEESSDEESALSQSSDAASSSDASEDHGDSDSETGVAVSSRFTQRSVAPAQEELPNMRISDFPKSTHLLTPEGMEQLRQVWLQSDKKLFRIDAKNKLWACPPPNSGVERDKFQRLNNAHAQLRSHCASFDEILNRAQQMGARPNVGAFTDCVTLLQSRLSFLFEHRFDKFSIYAHIRQMRMTRMGLFWYGYRLCDTCYSAVSGFSKNTLNRNTGTVLKKEEMKARIKRHTKAKQVAERLKDMAITQGERLPETENKAQHSHFVLPYRTQDSCREQLQLQVQAQQQLAYRITPSTFDRAKKLMKALWNIHLNLGKQKKLARCVKCEKLLNKLTKAKAKAKRDVTKIELYQRLFDDHKDEFTEQRRHFDEKKAHALQYPWLLNVVTLDGMDTQKTSLPHYARKTKHKDVENSLQIRVVGAFYIGGAVPCIGITSFDDVPSKGGNASVTALEKMIDVNYECLDPDNIAPIPFHQLPASQAGPVPMDLDDDANPASAAAPPAAAASSVAAAPVAAVTVDDDNGDDEDDDEDDGQHDDTDSASDSDNAGESSASAASASAASIDPPPQAKPKVPFMWPEGLHVTFDNTASDCKNGHVFRFLGMLVALGVFCYITVSTLLVGHTHDIVDQMFSVWSRQLNLKDAATLKALHALFRKKYATQIYELKRMVDEANKARRPHASADPSVPPPIAERLVFLAQELGVQPMMILQSCVINADLWCYKHIPNITLPHVFYIVKEDVPADDADPLGPKVPGVSMYNRFLAESGKDTDVNQREAYRKTRFGPWTTRYTLLRMHEVPTDDPLRVPPLPVDTDPVRACLNQHLEENNMTRKQAKRFRKQLDKFDAATRALQSDCALCAQYIRELDEIGVIHRPKSATAAQKAAANKQNQAKATLKRNLTRHMREAPHDSLVMRGWWTKWIDRVTKVIRPYYIQRGLIANPTAAQQQLSGRTPHPVDLVRDRCEPLVTRMAVDQLCEFEHQLPKVGHFVLTRQNDPHQPFGLGKVIGHNGEKQEGEGELEYNSDEESDADHRAEGQIEGPSMGAAAAAAAASSSRSRPRLNRSAAKDQRYCGDNSDDGSDSDDDGRPEGAPAPKARISAAKSQAARKRAASPSTSKPLSSAKLRKSGGAAASSATDSGKPTMFTLQWWDFVQVSGKRSLQPNDPVHLNQLLDKTKAESAQAGDKLQSVIDRWRQGDFTRMPAAAFSHWQKVSYREATQAWQPEEVERKALIWWGPKKKMLTSANRLLSAVWKKLEIDLVEPDQVQAEQPAATI
jgi:hypothetical protein